MYNKAILMGRLTKDPEMKTTQNGKSVTHFSIAVDRRFTSEGEKQADFFNCVAWGKTAEFINQWFKKGQSILVEGEIQNRSYNDKEGVTKYVTEIIIDRACFTGEKRGNDGAPRTEQPQAQQPYVQQPYVPPYPQQGQAQAQPQGQPYYPPQGQQMPPQYDQPGQPQYGNPPPAPAPQEDYPFDF